MSTHYRLLAGLDYPTDPRVVRRHARGDIHDGDRARNRDVPLGAVVDDLPAHSLPWLLEQGLVVETTDAVSSEAEIDAMRRWQAELGLGGAR